MKTPATEEFPTIEWEQHSLMDKDIDERSETWEVKGFDANGNKYIGIGDFSCEELVCVNQIEITSK